MIAILKKRDYDGA